MKISLTSAFLLLSLTSAFANPPTTVQRTLTWQPEVTVLPAEDSESATLWRFKGAVYNEAHPSLPYFSERFKLDGYGSMQAVFAETAWEPFEKKATPDDEALEAAEPHLNISVEKDRLDWFGRVAFIPIRRTGGGRYERLVSFTLRLSYSAQPQPVKPRGGNTYTSVLSEGDIWKFAVSGTGVHKLDFDFLKNKLGIPLENVDPRSIKLYGNGGGILPERVDAPRADDLVENAIEVSGEGDGKFDSGDFILFYGEGADKQVFDSTSQTFSLPKNFYSDQNFYFLKIGGGNGLRIQNQPSVGGSTYTSTTFDDFQRYEEDIYNVMHDWIYGQGSGRQWFGDNYKVQVAGEYGGKFDLTNLAASSPVKLEAAFAGRIKSGSFGRYSVTANGTTFSSVNFGTTKGASTDTYANLLTVGGEFSASGNPPAITLNFEKGGDAFNEGWLDYIQLNFRRQLSMLGDQMRFRDLQALSHAVSQFRLAGASGSTAVWDVTDPLAPRRQELSLAGSELSFSVSTDALREFTAFNTSGGFLSAEAVGKVENQNLHAYDDADMAVVFHKDFKAEAERFAEHRSQHSGYSVALVDVEQLFNEFSSGRKDAGAIRDFAKMVFDRSPERFRSLLLFGDGSFDARDIYKLGGDFVPVYETAQSLSPIYAYPTDDFFTLLSDGEGGVISTGSMDIGVGRLPVKDEYEAKAVVDKIIRYDTEPATLRDWRNRIAFVGDDEDGNLHTGDAEGIAVDIGAKNKNINLDKIYLDAFPQVSTSGGTRVPLATDAMNNDIFKGVLAMIYLGHGGAKGWAQERVLKIEDILQWQNFDKMPLIITATCSFSGYDNPTFTSAGELASLKDQGGAIGLFTTVRPVFASANEKLTRESMDTLFYKFNHEVPTLGEVLRLSKNKVGDISNSRKFTLLGDPSLQLGLPNYQVATTKVNGHNLDTAAADTIRALSKVTIEGEIQDDFGNLISNFNGVVYPTIFDKKVRYRTLSTDAGSPPFDFDLQKNVIFKGRASVSGGRFQFTFVVPKDINYTFGNSKISYYAADEAQHEDAAGNYQGVVVGGTDPNALADDRGTKVEVFMGSENFVFGGITNPDPVLLVRLEDDNGINVVGNSIGHDLAGILDKNTQGTYILNDFYEAALDDYTRGEVRYPLYNLAEGRHEIKVNAWDIANNPAEGFTEFVVVTSEKAALRHVLNFPNPFTTSTCFGFEMEPHQPGVELDVLIHVHTVSGKLIKSLEQRIISDDARLGSGCIQWDGRDDFGDALAKGVYLYKVKIRSAAGGDLTLTGESDFEKLVILK